MRFAASLAALTFFLAGPSISAEVAAGYVPADKDERGLWAQVEEQERKLKTSGFIMRDPTLNAYVRNVFCRTVGQQECDGVRIYLMRSPIFNASMAPNGMMLVYSGLFLRIRNEAQLATVLGHEYIHYRERHGLKLFREIKGKTSAIAWLSVIPLANIGVGLAVATAQYGMIGSLFSFSREAEREADSGSLALLVKAGYDPTAASGVWKQVEAERDATAAARHKKRKSEGGFFATHPNSAERVEDLKTQASGMAGAGTASVNREEYRNALAPFWADLIDDQVKLNDFGGTELLIGALASDGWTPELLFARGELYRTRGGSDDLKRASSFYREAIASGAPPVEAFRGLGLSLIRSGVSAEGQGALKEYLVRSPQAGDRAMLATLAGGETK